MTFSTLKKFSIFNGILFCFLPHAYPDATRWSNTGRSPDNSENSSAAKSVIVRAAKILKIDDFKLNADESGFEFLIGSERRQFYLASSLKNGLINLKLKLLDDWGKKTRSEIEITDLNLVDGKKSKEIFDQILTWTPKKGKGSNTIAIDVPSLYFAKSNLSKEQNLFCSSSPWDLDVDNISELISLVDQFTKAIIEVNLINPKKP
jgi:hypothetical protein